MVSTMVNLSVVQVAAGDEHTAVLTSLGHAYACGQNELGQLGDGTSTHRLSPVRIEGYGADTAMRLPRGGANALAMFVVAPDGTAMGSGPNNHGQLGNGGTDSVVTAGPIPALGGGIVEIARGYGYTLVLKGE